MRKKRSRTVTAPLFVIGSKAHLSVQAGVGIAYILARKSGQKFDFLI